MAYVYGPYPLDGSRWSIGGLPKRMGVVIHTYEAGEKIPLERIVANLATPGTRVVPNSDPPRHYGSCYHAFADYRNGSYWQVLGSKARPNAAGGVYNKNFYHICIPGYARRTREQWLSEVGRQQIRGVARFIYDRHKTDKFPLDRRIIADERDFKARAAAIKALKTQGGLCGHRDVTVATNTVGGHSDPGPNFPWDVLLDDIKTLLEDEMRIVSIVDDAGRKVDDRTWVVRDWTLDRMSPETEAMNSFFGNQPTGTVRVSDLKFYKSVGETGPFQHAQFRQ